MVFAPARLVENPGTTTNFNLAADNNKMARGVCLNACPPGLHCVNGK